MDGDSVAILGHRAIAGDQVGDEELARRLTAVRVDELEDGADVRRDLARGGRRPTGGDLPLGFGGVGGAGREQERRAREHESTDVERDGLAGGRAHGELLGQDRG